jgi:aminoglycoside 6'-N-acetyltransferase I
MDPQSPATNVELKLSQDDDAYIIKNLWPLYQHDISEFHGSMPNRHGLFGVDDAEKTLSGHVDLLSPWWRDPEALFPYLIVVDGHPAGFNLIAARQNGIDADFVVHEFFVLHAYRQSSAAERGAMEGFDKHRGSWEVVTWPNHARAIAFWRRVVSRYSQNRFTENEVDHRWGRRVSFHFENSLP